jgi:hypothetical protein
MKVFDGLRVLSVSEVKVKKEAYFQCFKNATFLQKLINPKVRLPETNGTISRSAPWRTGISLMTTFQKC